MKNLGKTLLVLLTVNTFIMAQEKEYKSFEVNRELTINVSARQLWQVVGPEFENAYVWASTVDHSVGKGVAEFEGATCSERYCDLNAKGFSEISERLIRYSDSDMNLAYEVVEGMPKFVVSVINDWTVVPVSESQSKLVMKADFKVKGLMGGLMRGIMKSKMEKLLDQVLLDARVYSETGMPSEVKQQRLKKLKEQQKVAA